jgi:hypothetical protein
MKSEEFISNIIEKTKAGRKHHLILTKMVYFV